MNSTSFLQWFKYNGKTKGKNYEFYSTPLKETPIYYPENHLEVEYVANLVKKQIKNYNDEIQNEIDDYFEKIFMRNLWIRVIIREGMKGTKDMVHRRYENE